MLKTGHGKPKPRSRLGCTSCKKIKQKCNELKPKCTRCIKKGIPCEYTLEMIFQKPKTGKEGITCTQEKLKTQPDSEVLQVLNPRSETELLSENMVLTGTSIVPNIPSFIPVSSTPILPLPENLLDHDYFKGAFEFYKHFTGHLIVAATPQIYKTNPMCTIIPKLATENSCLLDVLVSHALNHRSVVLADENYNSNLVELLVSRGMQRLVSSMKNESNLKKEVVCITALYVCTQKIFSGRAFNEYDQYIDLTRSSLEDYIRTEGSIKLLDNGKYLVQEDQNHLAYFLLTWVGYLEIVGLMMAVSPNNYKMPRRDSVLLGKYEMKNTSKIDLFLGFNIVFLFMFDKLIPLVNLVEGEYSATKFLPTDVLSKAIEWEHEFNDVYAKFKSSKGKPSDISHQNAALIASNDAFYYAGILNLYRRVYRLPRTNSVVQRMVRKIFEIFKNVIDPASNTELCAIFPFFIAACESVSQEHRQLFYTRFEVQFLGGNFPAGDVLNILKDTWNTGDSWTKSVERMKKQDGFFLI